MSRIRSFGVVVISLALGSASVLAQSDELSQRGDNNLIVARYNVKWLGDGTRSYEKFAEMNPYFDVCGALDIKKEGAFEELVKALEATTDAARGYGCGGAVIGTDGSPSRVGCVPDG